MGVYPMLPDGTCWFLAVDFDKATWTADVRAFVATCRRLELPFAVERSRSGNAAHVSETCPSTGADTMVETDLHDIVRSTARPSIAAISLARRVSVVRTR